MIVVGPMAGTTTRCGLPHVFRITDTDSIRIDESFELTAGSAHTAGLNTGFADGSVRFINYDIEPETFNRMAHRSDGGSEQSVTDELRYRA